MKKLGFVLDKNALNQSEVASDYVDVKALAAGVSKAFVKPTASTKILFSTNFAAGDTIMFGEGVTARTLTCVASGAVGDQFVPAGTLALTVAALVTQLNALAATLSIAGVFSATDAGASITHTTTTSAVPIRANTAKATGTMTISKVDGAKFVRLSAGTLFYYCLTTTAAVAGADVTGGLGSISCPSTVQPWFAVEDIGSISVISPTVCQVSAEWWA